MTELLGSKHCIDSLSKDLENVQETIKQIVSSTGRLECTSWKFPTKNACELDIDDMLENYSYSKDVSANQFSHIALFELIIDRFCLLLQSVSRLCDKCILNDRQASQKKRPQSRTISCTMSVGLISRRFWDKITEVQDTYHQMEKEVVDYNGSLMKLENDYAALKMELEKSKLKRTHFKEKMKNPEVDSKEDNSSHAEKPESRNCHTQTFETAFVPCGKCEDMQKDLYEIGNEVVLLCEEHSIPSNLKKLKHLFKNMTMTSSDIENWRKDQTKDILKIRECITLLKEEKEELKAHILSNANETESLRKKNYLLENDIETMLDQIKEIKESIAEKINEITITKEEVQKREEIIANLSNEKELLKNKLEKQKEEFDNRLNSFNDLEKTVQHLSAQLATASAEKDNELQKALKNEKTHTAELERKNEDLLAQLKELKISFDKTKTEMKVLLKHDQTTQSKQANLLQRLEQKDDTIEELHEEIVTLKEHIESLEGDRVDLNEKYEEVNKKLVTLQEIEQNETTNLSSTEIAKKLKLVVNYPILSTKYADVEQQYEKILRQFQNGTDEEDHEGDVVKDMQNQLEANMIRLTILKEENQTLRNNLSKLSSINESIVEEKTTIFPEIMSSRDLKEQEQYVEERKLGEMPVQQRNEAKSNRPKSGRQKKYVDITDRLANLERKKNSNNMKTSQFFNRESKAAWGSVDETNKSESIICPDCGKLYLSQRDLDIHRTFCYGKF